MRTNMPTKMYRFSVLTSKLTVLLLLYFPIMVLADQVSNQDRALFWSIQKDGKQAGYLLGTIHSEDPRVLEFSEDFLIKLKESKFYAMELVPDLPTLTRLTEYMQYPPGQTLQSAIGAARFDSLTSVLSTHGIPLEMFNRLKPWAAMMTLSMPPPETGFFMDLSLSLRATGNGLEVVGLETLEEQLSFLEEMPLPMQLSLLDQAIAQYDQVNDVHDQMVDAYLKNNLHELEALTEKQLEEVGQQAGAYFIDSGIHSRNQRMAQSLLLQLEHGTVFVAVGALHLPGEKGLINILRRQGFVLNPLKIPFAESRVTPGQ